jgi:hypothetical protein
LSPLICCVRCGEHVVPECIPNKEEHREHPLASWGSMAAALTFAVSTKLASSIVHCSFRSSPQPISVPLSCSSTRH